ncbi:MAG: type IV secretion system DNA-binding domain-containing protein [Candidatus Peregrinibacteria bacterium]|nr:type IV secretion system DNA-binding domain-containing protein [Candidatus Peregrinibacteria bacterium]MDZ4245209.1 type IV secretion system DNA-binding domain-containing protein [Candidatus Gracilibacteria bacterium]
MGDKVEQKKDHSAHSSGMEILHVIVSQGTPDNPKLEKLFLSFLDNLHNTSKGKRMAFEMFGYNQYTYFFVAVETEVARLVEGLIYSTFPGAEIKPMDDYTRFYNPEENTLMGTSITLKMSDIYPLKIYNEFEEDSLSGIFSVISKMAHKDQAWIQILVNPRDDNWAYHFERKMKMKYNKFKRNFRLKNYARLKDKNVFFEEENSNFVSKTEFNPFEIQIKFGAVAKTPAEAKKNLIAIAKAFYQFNKTDYNEFILSKAKKGDAFLKEYKARKMTTSSILSAQELATLYHFPNADHVPHVVHVLAKKHEPPKDLPTGGENVSMFGKTNYHNNFEEFGIKREDRRRHLYVVGKSGTGKSKLLEMLVQQDIINGHGVGVLDPHGDLVDNILRMVPEHRMKDVIYFDPGDTEFPIAFNPLEKVDEKYKMQLTIGFIDIFKKLFGTNWSDRLEHVLRYTTLALLDSPNTTVLSILKMLSDKNYRQSIVARITDSVVKNFWVNEFAGWSEKFDAEAITPLLNKVGQLVSTNMVRNMIGQPINTFDIRDVMDNQKILLMKVSKGLLGEENSQLLGSMIITKVYQSAMARADMKEEDRKDFYFYVDEFQNFATDTFSEILSEARKYHLCLTIAHQYIGQLNDDVRKTVFGNVGSMISFRVGAEDAIILADEYTPVFSVRDIINLGVREFYTKLSIDGELSEAFSGRTLDIKYEDKDFSREIIAQSREKYAKSREVVEELLTRWDEGSTEKVADVSNIIKQEEDFEMPLI